ncbi:MAG: hypothetical protein MHM6MM_003890 [Cercozoa sp. M6MM]
MNDQVKRSLGIRVLLNLKPNQGDVKNAFHSLFRETPVLNMPSFPVAAFEFDENDDVDTTLVEQRIEKVLVERYGPRFRTRFEQCEVPPVVSQEQLFRATKIDTNVASHAQRQRVLERQLRVLCSLGVIRLAILATGTEVWFFTEDMREWVLRHLDSLLRPKKGADRIEASREIRQRKEALVRDFFDAERYFIRPRIAKGMLQRSLLEADKEFAEATLRELQLIANDGSVLRFCVPRAASLLALFDKRNERRKTRRVVRRRRGRVTTLP